MSMNETSGRSFLSTPSARRATFFRSAFRRLSTISIHALREEGDSIGCATFSGRSNFYPRPPRGGRPVIFIVHPPFGQFLSTPSARRATRARSCACRCDTISIHALREEGDYTPSRQQVYAERFLSTPSARRATYFFMVLHSIKSNFYPRPPRGGRHAIAAPKGQVQNFYPRPPRGGRRRGLVALVLVRRFLSTPSARRATAAVLVFYELDCISIHALREEGDARGSSRSRAYRYFYPRPPRGGRRLFDGLCVGFPLFLSTPSVRRATYLVIGFRPFGRFLSTPSARRATSPIPTWRICDHISIHALREEGDQHDFHVWCIHDISIHALREEGDKADMITTGRYWHFYPRPPRGGRPGQYGQLPDP